MFSVSTHCPRALREHASVSLRHFAGLREAKEFLDARNARIIGVEIVDGALNVDQDLEELVGGQHDPPDRPIALVMGNEVRGSR